MSTLKESNSLYWRRQPLSEVVHGLDIPIELMKRLYPRSERDNTGQFWPWYYEIYELGAGNANIGKSLSELGYFQVRAIDINQNILQVGRVLEDGLARLTVLSGHVGDVTKWGEAMGKDSILGIERVDGIVVQALIPSLLGNGGYEWRDMLDAASMWLAPNKYLIINDFRRGDLYYSPLTSEHGPAEWRKQMRRWSDRYKANQVAFSHLGIPPRAFIVGRPNTEGKLLELGDDNQLKYLYSRDDLCERFAQHVDPNEINLHMRRLGFSLVHERMQGYHSRGENDLIAPTSLQVWQKSSKFQYHYIANGLDILDPDWEIIAVQRLHAMREKFERGSDFFRNALDILATLAPHSQLSSIIKLKEKFV